MNKIIALFLVLSAVSSAYAIKILSGPYLQQVDENSATVVWTTDVDGVSWVEIAPDDGSHFYATERPKFFDAPMGKKQITKIHRVKVSGLESGKKYFYRAFTKEITGSKGERFFYGDIASTRVYKRTPPHIKTLEQDKESLQFTIVNDIHEDTKRLGTFLSDTETDDFIVFNGDMVNNMRSHEQMYEACLMPATIATKSSKPILFARGNHETRGKVSESYMDFFPTDTGKPYFAKKIGKFFFVFLDSGEDKPDSDIEYSDTADFDNYRKNQAEWLKGIVESDDFKNAYKRIIITHIPPHWGTWHGSANFRKYFSPVMKGKKIDVIFSGHLHGEYKFYQPDENFDAPCVMNSNMEKVKVSVNKDEIVCDFYDVNMKKVRTTVIK